MLRIYIYNFVNSHVQFIKASKFSRLTLNQNLIAYYYVFALRMQASTWLTLKNWWQSIEKVTVWLVPVNYPFWFDFLQHLPGQDVSSDALFYEVLAKNQFFDILSFNLGLIISNQIIRGQNIVGNPREDPVFALVYN